MREADRAKQRFDVEPVRNDDERLERVGHAKRPDILRGRKDGETVSLKAPELVVIDQIFELLCDQRSRLLADASVLKLPDQGERRGGEHALDHKRQGETPKIVGQGSAPCAAPASRLRPGTAQIIEAREIKHIRFDAVRADKRALQ